MKKEIAQKWIRALRSGKYKQHNLQKDDLLWSKQGCYYNCFGVLNQISKLGVWRKHTSKYCNAPKNAYVYDSFNNGYNLIPDLGCPENVRKWANIKNSSELSILEELHRYTFKQLADYIQKNYKKL